MGLRTGSPTAEGGTRSFEGRSWHGLHRHALMTMIAYAFLQHRRLISYALSRAPLRRACLCPGQQPGKQPYKRICYVCSVRKFISSGMAR
jgi:hypothetical protein